MTNAECRKNIIERNPDSLIAKLWEVMTSYCEEQGVIERTAIRDVLTDIRHLCDVHDLSFWDVDTDAHNGYLEEIDPLFLNDEASR